MLSVVSIPRFRYHTIICGLGIIGLIASEFYPFQSDQIRGNALNLTEKHDQPQQDQSVFRWQCGRTSILMVDFHD